MTESISNEDEIVKEILTEIMQYSEESSNTLVSDVLIDIVDEIDGKVKSLVDLSNLFFLKKISDRFLDKSKEDIDLSKNEKSPTVLVSSGSGFTHQPHPHHKALLIYCHYPN